MNNLPSISPLITSDIDSILWLPITTPEQWCQTMPCSAIPFTDLILNQPLSTLLVYLLGLMWLWGAWRFWQARSGHKAKIWWAIALTLGGTAAITAGTSYQAFSYELKCVGRVACVWTNGWEVSYMLMQAANLNAMLIAVAYSCTSGAWRKALISYAILNSIGHAIVTLMGAVFANKFMLSFELLVLFTTPTLLLVFGINGWRYTTLKNPMDLALLGAWLLLLLVNVLYFAYLWLGYTQTLWAEGIWFSENDVLHVGMVFWILYMVKLVNGKIKDQL